MPATLSAGTLVAGKLRIVRPLGQGGMGAVYEVEHEFTKHRRALKLLHAEMAKHEHIVERFLREASAAGRIGNRHIVESFDAGTLDTGEPYLVMELLDGETLEARLARLGVLPVEEIADLVGQACDGVQAAHEAGIVHRDLKPENLFAIQGRDGPLLKILDFGISRFDPTVTGAHAVTREGSMVGTPYYMSPEQIEGDRDLDARADVYALGVILYECATGQRPYEAPALPMLSVLIHAGKPRPLAELRPDLPQGFADLVARAMARDRDARFQSARALGDALAHFGSSALGVTMEEPLQREPSRRPAVRVSDLSPSPSSEAGRAALKAAGVSVAGAALSVADERRPALRGLVIASAVVAGLGGLLFVVLPRNTATVRAVGPGSALPATSSMPPTGSSAPPSPASVSTPIPEALPPAASAPAPATQPRPASTGGSKTPQAAAAAPSATAAPVKPTSSSHAVERGLAGPTENPY
jgi:serine/threonine protein kinase